MHVRAVIGMTSARSLWISRIYRNAIPRGLAQSILRRDRRNITYKLISLWVKFIIVYKCVVYPLLYSLFVDVYDTSVMSRYMYHRA